MNWHDWAAALRENIGWLVAGIGGRMIFHGREAQAGRRKFWGRDLLFELPIAIGMGFLGKAVAVWMGLGAEPAAALAGAAGYLGPRAIDVAWDRVMKTKD